MSKDSSMTFDDIANLFGSKFLEVDLPLFAASEHEAIGLEHFLVEPKCNRHYSGVFDVETFHSRKFFDVEDFSGAIQYDEIEDDCRAVNSCITQEAHKEKQFSEEMSQGADDGVNNEKTRIPTTGQEFLSEPRAADKVTSLVQAPSKEPCQKNVCLESHSPDFYKRDLASENQVGLDNGLNHIKCEATSYEVEGKILFSSGSDPSGSATGSICGVSGDETSVDWYVEMKRSASVGAFKTSSELSEVEFCSLDEGEKALVTQKRMRKPPKRYIEESLEPKSRHCNVKSESIQSCKHYSPKGSRATRSVCLDKSFKGSCIQVPFGLPVEERHMKTNTSFWFQAGHKHDQPMSPKELSGEPSLAESQDDVSEDEFVMRSYTEKGSSHRKNHISWTAAEVMKLIEGVSQCGVGRWAEIKRQMFPSSSRRTSVDLKDKWRNLLRASFSELQSKRKVKQGRKQASHRVPETVLWRVRELATTYSCARKNKSKVSCTAPVPSSFLASTNNMSVPLSTTV